ncbi:hypothetical protein ACKWTF_013270 [Chironomus riparius]
MNFLFINNNSKSQILGTLSHLIVGSCILVYLSYTIVKESNYYDQQCYEIRQIHSDLDTKLLNVDVEDFMEPKTLIVKSIQEDEEILKSEKFNKLFFIETHMDEMRILDNPRIACSIESAARVNQDARIYLFFLTNSTRVVLKYSEQVKILLSYDNINIRFLNIYEFSKGTDLEDLIGNDSILKSKYPIEHMADVMRALILSKYSGIYLDLDVLSVVPLAMINYENFACPESINRITNAVIRVNEQGRKVMKLYVKKLSISYNSNGYSDNGPKLFSESIKEFCNGTDLKTIESENVMNSQFYQLANATQSTMVDTRSSMNRMAQIMSSKGSMIPNHISFIFGTK